MLKIDSRSDGMRPIEDPSIQPATRIDGFAGQGGQPDAQWSGTRSHRRPPDGDSIDDRYKRISPTSFPDSNFCRVWSRTPALRCPASANGLRRRIDPAEIEKRIDELRTVQFWLEQNAKMLSATIQALEVQRMTLSTLKTMNVQMADLRDSLQIKVPEQKARRARRSQTSRVAPARQGKRCRRCHPRARRRARQQAWHAPAVDPMQWWGALTKQFTELATNAIQQGASTGLASADGPTQASTASTMRKRPTLHRQERPAENPAQKANAIPRTRRKSQRLTDSSDHSCRASWPSMTRFVHAHAGHADWRIALRRRNRASPRNQVPAGSLPTLGWAYFSDYYVDSADALAGRIATALA